ncbi:MAG: tRNA pseudouridine(38-40) synthase TruA [Chlamydiales bacterium]|nr:tRNA pseudouridine(38-40) synthase TruA [Chlamydiia bacterium]MCP5508657.1 tRNA pseudouridine(38-40) synthase TruA [Chlamydiales bacterium]
MRNIRLIVAYDGGNYLGWQKTAMGPSIEDELQRVLQQVLQHPVTLQAASRTDAGVHARGQVVNFFTENSVDLNKLMLSVNSLLPDAIKVMLCTEADSRFHPTIDAKRKQYRYYICLGPAQYPEYRHFSWHCPYPLDRQTMEHAKEQLIGEHDFSAFCNVKKNESYENLYRKLERIAVEDLPDNRLCIIVEGEAFLYKMVRNIVGTLVYVGRGKISLKKIGSIIENKDRTEAGMTAPAHGLTLHHVDYETATPQPEQK